MTRLLGTTGEERENGRENKGPSGLRIIFHSKKYAVICSNKHRKLRGFFYNVRAHIWVQRGKKTIFFKYMDEMFLCLQAVFKFTVHYDFDFMYIYCNLFFQNFTTGPYIYIILCVIYSNLPKVLESVLQRHPQWLEGNPFGELTVKVTPLKVIVCATEVVFLSLWRHA